MLNANNDDDLTIVNNSFALGKVDKLDMVFCLFIMWAFNYFCLFIIMF